VGDKERPNGRFADRSSEILKKSQVSLLGTLKAKFEPSEIQKKIYPRGVYFATIDTTGQDVLSEYLVDMEDVGVSLLAHIVDAAANRVDVVLLFFHPLHQRSKYGCNENVAETEVMFLYSDEPADKWSHSAAKTSIGSEIYLLGEIGNVNQPFRDVVLGHEGTLDQSHWRFPVLFDHLSDIMNADWEVGYVLRQSPWSQALYAASKKKVAEKRASKDFAKILEKSSSTFTRTPETKAVAPSTTIASMDTISRMSAQSRRETQSAVNREDVRSLYESVFREENDKENREENANAVFNRCSYVNMLKKSLGKSVSAIVYTQDEQSELELKSLENEAGDVISKLARARARFAFVRGKTPKTRSGKTIDTSSMISSVSARERRSSKVDESVAASGGVKQITG